MSSHAWRRAAAGIYLTRMEGHNGAAIRVGIGAWVAQVDGDALPGTHARAFDAKRAAEGHITRMGQPAHAAA